MEDIFVVRQQGGPYEAQKFQNSWNIHEFLGISTIDSHCRYVSIIDDPLHLLCPH